MISTGKRQNCDLLSSFSTLCRLSLATSFVVYQLIVYVNILVIESTDY